MTDAFEAGLDKARTFLASISDAAEKATAAALNKAGQAARNAADRAIAERYAVKPSDVRERLQLARARIGDLTATLTARSGSVSLTYYPHTPLVSGTGGRGRPLLRAEVLRAQSKAVDGAFVATIGGKARIVMRTSKRGDASLRVLSSVPIGVMLAAESVREAVETKALETFEGALDKEIDKALGRNA